MVAHAHWSETTGSGISYTGSALPQTPVNIPALATVQRVIFSMVCTGSQSSAQSGDYRSVQGVYLYNQIVIDDGSNQTHLLHKDKVIIPGYFTSLYDNSVFSGGITNRYFYALYQAGDRELGCNIKTSWGGPGHLGYAVALRSGFFRVGNQQNGDVLMGYELSLRVLYYTNP